MGTLWVLVQPNATVTVETFTLTEDAAGGQVETWATVTAGVECLISLANGGRVPMFGGNEFNAHTGTLRSEVAAVARQDVRLLVTAAAKFPALVGKYLRVESAERHPGSDDDDIPPSYVAKWKQWAGGSGA